MFPIFLSTYICEQTSQIKKNKSEIRVQMTNEYLVAVLHIAMTTYLLTPWHYSSCRTLAASHILCEVSWRQIFTGWGHQPYAQPPTWRTRVSLLVWHLPWNLSSKGGPISCYAAPGIALEFIGAHKPPHPATKCFRQGGDTIEGVAITTFTPNFGNHVSNCKQHHLSH
jgi:hypothetical protein